MFTPHRNICTCVSCYIAFVRCSNLDTCREAIFRIFVQKRIQKRFTHFSLLLIVLLNKSLDDGMEVRENELMVLA